MKRIFGILIFSILWVSFARAAEPFKVDGLLSNGPINATGTITATSDISADGGLSAATAIIAGNLIVGDEGATASVTIYDEAWFRTFAGTRTVYIMAGNTNPMKGGTIALQDPTNENVTVVFTSGDSVDEEDQNHIMLGPDIVGGDFGVFMNGDLRILGVMAVPPSEQSVLLAAETVPDEFIAGLTLTNGAEEIVGLFRSETGDLYASGSANISGSNGIGIQATGTVTVGHDNGTSGYDVNFYGIYGGLTGGRMFWDASKSTFRAGRDTDGTHWNDANAGSYSFAAGLDTTANGNTSTALGRNTAAGGNWSTALGYYTTAGGIVSTAIGYGTTASGEKATAMGSSTTASGDWSTAMGKLTTASGNTSIAMGNTTTASGDYSLTAGQWVTAGPANNTITLGEGADSSNRLANNIASSLMIGFDSDVPTLFVGPSSGIGTTGKVGIATTTTTYDLTIDGDIGTIGSSGNIYAIGIASATSFIASGISGVSGCFDAGDSGEHIAITGGIITEIAAGNCP